MLRGGTAISNGADMDDYTTPGNYYSSSTSISSSLQNAPFSTPFTLKIENANGIDYPCQTFREYNTGRIAWRWKNITSSAWSQFVYFSDDATLFAGTAIQSGDDLNDYTTPGIYRSTSSGITATLLNIPEIFSSGFSMLVFNMSLAANTQVIFAGNNMYMRFANTSEWQAWFKYSGAIISS